MATVKTFPLGSLIHIRGSFADATPAPIDPDDVYFHISGPNLAATTYKYGVDPELFKTEAGEYYIDWNCSVAGTYYCKWYSSGVGQAATSDFSFIVSASKFEIPAP